MITAPLEADLTSEQLASILDAHTSAYFASYAALLGAAFRTNEYVITSGAFMGQRGCFTRDHGGLVVGVDLAGRFFNRVSTAAS